MGNEPLEKELAPFEILKAPCSPEEIEWKQQTKAEKDSKNWAIFVPYVNARALMQRLDMAFDHFWSSETEYMGINKKGMDQYRCTIKVRVSNSDMITRTGWSEATDIEPVKGGESNAFKRAGTMFGFGRELYNYPTVKVRCVGKWPPFGYKKFLDYVSRLFLEGKVNGEDELVVYGHKDNGKKDLKLHFVEYGKPGKEIHGGKAPRVKESPKSVDKPLPTKEKYTLAEITAKLFKKTNGLVKPEMEANVLSAWKKGDKKIHHGMYVWIANANGNDKIWFLLNAHQKTIVFK
jgi:hypothetical protein